MKLSAIPGIDELWELTRGDPRVRVAVIDGPPDLEHPCFAGAAIEVVPTGWSPPGCDAEIRDEHATFVTAMIVGQPESTAAGLAPGCTALVVPGVRHKMDERDPLNTARCLEAAIAAGADVVLLEQALPSRSNDTDELLRRAAASVREAGALLVMPAGNEEDDFANFPQAIDEGIVVGAHRDDGVVFRFSSFGYGMESRGIVAPGGDITSAAPGGGLVTHKGTSCSGPVVAAVAGLLLSLQAQAGRPPDPLAIGELLLETAAPCTSEECHGEPQRCLRGKLDVAAATRRVLLELGGDAAAGGAAAASPASASGVTTAAAPARATGVVTAAEPPKSPAPAAHPAVYALGTLGYDFGTQARRDSFKALMAPAEVDGTVVPADPHSVRQLLDHLQRHPDEAEALIWTLSIELTPIYAIGPLGATAPAIFALLVALLGDQHAFDEGVRRVGRVAIPGRLSGRTVKLFSGQVVPIIEVAQTRGMHGWATAELSRAVLERAAERDGTQSALRELLTRLYFELRNLGLTGADRALNFALTAAFAPSEPMIATIAAGLALDAITVAPGEHCRPGSDCRDVTLRFFDPENLRRARRVHRCSVDVGDGVPVALGPVRTWAESPPRRRAATIAAATPFDQGARR